MSNAVEFHNVSKSFRIDRDRPRTFQELFIQLFRRSRRDANIFWALRDVSFTIERGSSVGLIGTNGAGKSTTLKLISRIIQPTHGQITVNGRVTALLELGAGFHPELSGRDNIYLNGAVMGLSRREIARKLDEIVEFAEIEDFIDVPVKDYSSGMYLRLAFSAAAHLDPEILLLDEVFAVGDQGFQQKSQERIQELRKRGITILFVSHSMEAVLQTCQRAIWLERGRVRAAGDVSAVSAAYYEDTLVRMAKKQVAKATTPEKQLADQQKRLGSGEARVERVEFIDADGRSTRFTHTNARLTVRVHYHARERVDKPLIGVAFYRADQRIRIAGPNNTTQPYKIPYIEGSGYVDYTIARLPFLPGEYVLDAAIYDWDDTHRYDYWNECARFTVLPGGTRERYGLIALEGQWHHPGFEDAGMNVPARAHERSNGAFEMMRPER
ncbi:MAG: ABC transporter [Candidatus Roseilinea sp.]|nr:MAG: ABC transporter [Candidatus Roseilinea sp.]